MPRKISEKRLRSKIEEYFAIQEQAQAAYKESDRLLEEIAQHLKVEKPFHLSESEIVTLSDQFAGKTIVWGHGGVRRFKLERQRLATGAA